MITILYPSGARFLRQINVPVHARTHIACENTQNMFQHSLVSKEFCLEVCLALSVCFCCCFGCEGECVPSLLSLLIECCFPLQIIDKSSSAKDVDEEIEVIVEAASAWPPYLITSLTPDFAQIRPTS